MKIAARDDVPIVEQFRPLFYPESVALIGASSNPAKIGYLALQNILQWGFEGPVFPINPDGKEILGLKSYPSLASVPVEKIDLAMIARPAAELPSVLEECRRKGIRGAVIVSGGLKEMGTREGRDIEDRMACIATPAGMKIIGPNTIGMVSRNANLNVSFQDTLAALKPGNISLITQSGGTCMYMVHQLMNMGVGVSKAMSLGNRCNIDFPELMEYLAEDKDTRVVILHIEGLDNAQKFIAAGQKLSSRKPVLSYKVGNFESLSRAVSSHTGALATRPEVQRAALRQAGFLQLTSTTDLVDAAKALSFQPCARGNRFAVLSPQAGPAIIISDACQRMGMRLAEFTPASQEKLYKLVDPTTYKDNPIDMAVTATRYDESLETLKIVAGDANVDIIICATLYHGTYIHLLRALINSSGQIGKPVVVCSDSPICAPNQEIVELERLKIPTYPLPERAALAAWALAAAGGLEGS